MQFELNKSIQILERTPRVLYALLSGLNDDWIIHNEGLKTWSPFDVIGHLIHGEKTDWIIRARIILSDAEDKTFVPFDRFAQLSANRDKSLNALLDEFSHLRKQNITILRKMQLTESELALHGVHPELGVVTLRQLLSTWTAHDLGHIAQISRVMARQYRDEVGPWIAYLGILRDR